MKIYKISLLILGAISMSLSGMTQGELNKEFLRAVQQGKVKEAEEYLSRGADVNFKNQWGNSALVEAAKNGNREMIKALLQDPRINVNVFNFKGDNALVVAAQEGYLEIVRLLLDADALVSPMIVYRDGTFRFKNKALIDAAKRGYIDIVRLLLERRAETSAVNAYGNTALIEAIKNGQFETVRLLIARSNVNARAHNHNGDTPLILAVKSENDEIVRLLLKAGAHVDVVNNRGDMPLLMATEMQNVRILNLLLNYAMARPMNKLRISELNEEIRRSLRSINLRNLNSIEILKLFHHFARRYWEEFPGLEEKINELMNRALIKQGAGRKEVLENIMKHQRTLR